MTAKPDDDLDLLMLLLSPTSVWNTVGVNEESHIELIDWTIKQDRDGNGYFVGTRADDGTGRVSTPIVEFDAERRRGRTRSGRVYALVGPAGYSADGEYTWLTYKAVNRIVEDGS